MKEPPADARKVFGRAVKKRRLELGLSQEKLGELADLHRTYIADVERGARNVSLLSILKISQALRTSPSKLLEGIQ